MNKFWILFCLLSFAATANAELTARSNMVIDSEKKLLWYRCTIGMQFEPIKKACVGAPQPMSMAQVKDVIEQANEQLGGSWRLPNKRELKSLVCKTCESPKIDKDLFPNFLNDRYWTGQKNWMSWKNYWSINFYTGWTYGMSFPEQELYVLLVRDIR